ncbi:GAP family protein [Streptomyces sp. NPDC058614]|uniref:GAP family protein n=1 Tax=Streptomyces sp. NPDC058614 TaxID=3346557 RepID=UPI00364F6841
MLIQAIGAVLPAALAVALSPFPLIGIVLILAGRQGRRNGLLFAAGWITGLGIVATLAAVAFGGADDPESSSSAIADWGRVLAGVALIVLGARKWWQRPRAGNETETPRWMASLDAVSALHALLLGTLLSGANPKNLVLTASATTSIVEAGAHNGDLIVAVVVFVLIGSCTVLGAVNIHPLRRTARGVVLGQCQAIHDHQQHRDYRNRASPAGRQHPRRRTHRSWSVSPPIVNRGEASSRATSFTA